MAERAKTALLVAESGDSKTSQCVFIAKYIKRKYGKKTRLISADGGGWSPVEDEGLIYNAKTNPEGIVHAFNMTNRKLFLAEWRKLSRGEWPKVVKGEPSLGEDPTKGYRKMLPTSQAEMNEIGAYFIEGLTSISSGFLSHISKQDNSKESITKVMYAAPGYDEDGEHFGATDQGHVGMVQNELYNLTQQFGSLPVSMVVWTALVGKCTEKSLRQIGLSVSEQTPVFGPKLAGNAKNAEAPSWFSDSIYLEGRTDKEVVETSAGQQLIERKRIFAYFQRHLDSDGNLYLAKSSTGTTIFPKLIERFPGGCLELGFGEGEGIDRYFMAIDELKNQINGVKKV